MIEWPDLTSRQHRFKADSLEVQELAEGLFTVANVLSPGECASLVESCRAKLVPTNPTNRPPRKGEAFRNNDRFLIRDEGFAQTLWQYLSTPLSTIVRSDGARPVGFNPDFRLYRYGRGQSFGPHIDEPAVSSDGKWESEFTLLLYLTGGEDGQTPPLKGGATRFHLSKRGPPLDVEPCRGLMLLHWTGHDFLHEGCAVNSGEKLLLRTDVYFPRVRGLAGLLLGVPQPGQEGGERPVEGEGRRGGGGKGKQRGRKRG